MRKKTTVSNQEQKVSILALAVAIGSLIVSVRACSLSEKQMKLHLEPELVCVLNDHPEKDHFLLFTLKNEGIVKASTVSVDHTTLRYLKSEEKIKLGFPAGSPINEVNSPGKRWLFKNELGPNEAIYQLTGGSALRDGNVAVDVLVFDVKYYRESDGKEYNKRCLYYVEGKKINTPAQFRSSAAYEKIVTETARFLHDVRLDWSPNTETRQ